MRNLWWEIISKAKAKRTIQSYTDTAIQILDVLCVDLVKSQSRQELEGVGLLITDPPSTSFTTLLKENQRKKYIYGYM